MKILKEGKIDNKNLKATCEKCGCEFEYIFEEMEQENIDEWHMMSFVECPWCHERVILEKYKMPEQDRNYSLFPTYPDKFLFMGEDTVKISDEQLDKYVKKVYNGLKENPDEESYIIAAGDSMVVGFNREDGISLYVCRDYEEAFWDKDTGWLTEE